MRERRAQCGGLWSTVSRFVVLALWIGVPATADAQRPDPHHAEEVRFTNGALTLGGLWFVPEGDGPFPAAVMIRGSGPSRRDSYWARALVDVLLDAGTAVLLPDKRGSDASEGDWRTANFHALAGDALAGMVFARSRPEVRRESVGLVGLSQGGKIAAVAAAGSPSVAWVVNLVGASTTFKEQVSWEMYHTFREAGLEGQALADALDLQLTAEAYVEGTVDWSAYHRLLEPARASPWAEVARGFPPTSDAWQWDFFRAVIDFDPLQYWRRVQQPVLVFYGEEDHNAPAVRSAYRLLRAFRETGHPDATVRILPGTGHGLWDPEHTDAHRPVLHAELVAVLREWIATRSRSGRGANREPTEDVGR